MHCQRRKWVIRDRTVLRQFQPTSAVTPIADKRGARPDCPLSAIRGHRSPSKCFDRSRIHGTPVPVEEPSTASEADTYDHIKPGLRGR